MKPKRQEEKSFDLIGSLQLPRDDTSLRIVAVADLDLSSAAALAEYALTDVNISGGRADFLVACGPFCRDEDLKPYMTRRGSQPERTPELSAALEGLMTGALSQLESIVCRVCFCPAGPHDPETTLLPRGDEGPLRLTPNSRNILDEWMPLAPALGCGGLSVNIDQTLTEYSSELSKQVQQLVSIAPRFNDTHSCCTDTTQTILATSNINLNAMSLQLYFSSISWENVCLNIVGGTASVLDCAPDNCTRIVSPGSLRQHGDFCWIDLGLIKGVEDTYRWQVQHVEFVNIGATL